MRRALLTALLLAACAGDPTPATVELEIRGMVCESCSQAITHEVGKLEGVNRCEVDLERGSARVAYDPDRIDPATIEAKIDALGYEATPLAQGSTISSS